FSSEFRREFGETPHQYLLTRRLERAAALLRNTERSVADICLAWGPRVGPGMSRSGPRAARALVAHGELLHRPAVAVGVAEEDERPPGEVLDLAHLDPARDELGARSVDVRHDQLQALHRPGRDAHDAVAEGDRARGPRGRHLHEAEVVRDPVVVVGVEADVVDVERL